MITPNTSTRLTFRIPSWCAAGRPIPFSWLRPNQNQTRLSNMPMPAAMNTTL